MNRIFCLLLLLSAAYCSADNSILLEKADRIKSQQPQQFKQLLSELERNAHDLTTYEANYFKLLKAYRTIYAGEPAQAIQYAKEVYKSAVDEDLKLRALTVAVNLYGIVRNYIDGYNYAQQLIELIPNGSKASQVNAYAGLATFYNQLGDYESGLHAASWLLGNAVNPHTVCVAHQVKVESEYYLNREITPATADYAVNYCKEAKEYLVALISLVIKAKLYFKHNEVDEAISLLESNQEIYVKANYPVAQADYRAQLANFYLIKNQWQKAKHNAEEAIVLSSGAGMYKPRILAFEVLYKYFERVGNITQAHHYYKIFSEAQKALLDETKIRQLAIQQTKFEAQKKANQIALLNKENSLLKTQAELAQKEIDNSRLLIATFALLASIVMVWMLFNRRMQMQLKTQAQTDKLTGIANRHHFTQVAEKALSYHEKTQQHLSVVVFDLDLFKSVNDAHGHVIGDWALKAVVDVVKRVCRNQDVIGRLGGEEFAILLPGCAARKAQSITESCRSAIAAIDTSESGENFKVTASFGVADTKLCGYKFQSLYGCADKAMYRSKDEGRNRVYVYDGYPAEPFTLDEKFS
ncbi:tetratricopeptide repeat-containing diguanylate cyclase [Alteromonas sp. ASW11-130]|uniref:tetratricopeptide repeat-containing diguanylate cyclase n=1 Tax=Alteromonas sp. ASW11-130 TaxID=3015775 RepID=UPI0022428296|nr:GGDEF domain-containing protein [Alteromonas sp. ASW11-130]MCW8091466.1 GGDEF domain-containing protein [Alteromonas sp. ASW11-130]